MGRLNPTTFNRGWTP